MMYYNVYNMCDFMILCVIPIIKELPTHGFKYYSYLKEEKAHLSQKKSYW